MIDFYRVVTAAQESDEDFIFTTIQPFCEDVIKRKISKAELVKLLSQPKIVRCGECKFFVDEGMYCEQNIITQFEHFYCYYGERRADDER